MLAKGQSCLLGALLRDTDQQPTVRHPLSARVLAWTSAPSALLSSGVSASAECSSHLLFSQRDTFLLMGALPHVNYRIWGTLSSLNTQTHRPPLMNEQTETREK